MTPGTRRLLLLIGLGLTAASLGDVLLTAINAPSALSIFASETGLFLLIGFAVYLRSENRLPREQSDETGIEPARSTILILKILYVLSLTAAVATLRVSLYVPIALYYFAVIGAVGAIGTEIALRKAYTRSTEQLLLLQLLILGVLVQDSFAWLNPGSVY